MTVTTTITETVKCDDNSYLEADKEYEQRKVNEENYRLRSKQPLVWYNIVVLSLFHISALYGLYLALIDAQWKTLGFTAAIYLFSGIGVTIGAHRLWSHRSFKAKFPLKVFLMIANSMSAQNDIIEWVRDHRGHHKWSETDADPHNADRGMFFAHCGWLFMRKHPEVIKKGRTLLMDDVVNDPVCAFQKRHYKPLILVLSYILPTVVPHLLWGESLTVAFFVCGMLRYVLLLNAIWCVNSVAHWFGGRPYDISISPVESSFTSFVSLGEGFHNFHHSFPFDYRSAELPYIFGFSTACMHFFTFIGQAYDLKVATDTMIKAKSARSGPTSATRPKVH